MVRFSPASLILVVASGYLLYEGIDRQIAADVQLAEAIRAERIVSPPLVRMKSSEPIWRDLGSEAASA